ncbi:MAG: FAD-dependent oxidoreductase [Anaerolineae bacterium]
MDDTFLQSLIEGFGNWFEDEERLQDGRLTADLYPYTALFSPIQVNRLKLKNRIVMGPMGNVCMADETGRPSAKMIAYFAARAKGGVGLITSGLVPVNADLDPSITEPGQLSVLPRIDRSRTVYAGWRSLAEAIHAHGARFFIQLTSGLGRVGSPECLLKKLKMPVSASWNPSFYMPAIPCRPLTDGECRRLIVATGQAAADAKALTIDGVYLHGHEGYLLEQMTNPAFNRRQIGRFADWQAFGIESVQEVRARCGPDYPIMYRIDLSLALQATYGARMTTAQPLKHFQNERTVEMTLDYMRHLVAAGVDLFDVDLGCYENWWLPHPPGPMPPGCYLPVAKVVKQHFAEHQIKANTGLDVPIVAVGKLGYPDLAERALREGLCDMVMLARPLLADPDWPRKVYAGRVAEIRPCIGDQEACLNEFIKGGHPQCSVNPRTGLEDVYDEISPPATTPKKIAVVGAGPAGIVCACTAAQRGHTVTLFDKATRAGGMLRPGSRARIKFDIANYVAYLETTLAQTAERHALTTRFGVEMTAEALKAEGFDAIVTCTGGKPITPHIEGINLPEVIHAVELFNHPDKAADAEQVVVIGGGEVGCEAAYFLAYELEKQVTVVEMLPYFMQDACTANRGYLIHYLERKGVKLMNCAQVRRIGPGNVNVLHNVSSTVPDPYVTWQVVLPENVKNPLARPIQEEIQDILLPADLVVLATGFQPDDALYEACVALHAAPELHNIGDAFAPGNVFAATKAGYAVGRAL